MRVTEKKEKFITRYVDKPQWEINNWVEMKKLDDDYYEVLSIKGRYKLSKKYAEFLSALDGYSDPFEIARRQGFPKEKVMHTIYRFESWGFIRKGKSRDGNCLDSTVLQFGKPSTGLRIISRIFNDLMLVSFIPILILGIKCALDYKIDIVVSSPLTWLSIILGIYIPNCLNTYIHEFGHALSAFGYKNARAYEIGISRDLKKSKVGAYVSIDDVKETLFHRVQILLAGIEADLLTTGLVFILGKIEILRIFSVVAGSYTLILVLNNVAISLWGTDCAEAILLFIFKLGISEYMEEIVVNTKYAKRLWNRGIEEKGLVLASYFFALCHYLFLPSIIVFVILVVI